MLKFWVVESGPVHKYGSMLLWWPVLLCTGRDNMTMITCIRGQKCLLHLHPMNITSTLCPYALEYNTRESRAKCWVKSYCRDLHLRWQVVCIYVQAGLCLLQCARDHSAQIWCFIYFTNFTGGSKVLKPFIFFVFSMSVFIFHRHWSLSELTFPSFLRLFFRVLLLFSPFSLLMLFISVTFAPSLEPVVNECHEDKIHTHGTKRPKEDGWKQEPLHGKMHLHYERKIRKRPIEPQVPVCTLTNALVHTVK